MTGPAERMGRKLRSKYGTEPTFQNQWYPELRSIQIPNKSPLKRGTSRKILSLLELDLAAMRRELERLGGPIDDNG